MIAAVAVGLGEGLRWCSACRRAAVPDEETAEVVNLWGTLLRSHRTEHCPSCARRLVEHVTGPDARTWAEARAVTLEPA